MDTQTWLWAVIIGTSLIIFWNYEWNISEIVCDHVILNGDGGAELFYNWLITLLVWGKVRSLKSSHFGAADLGFMAW